MRTLIRDIDDTDTTTDNLITTRNGYTFGLVGPLLGTVERFGPQGDEFYTVEVRNSANTLVARISVEGIGLDELDTSQVFFILNDEAADLGILG